jgi:hypothetical protein
MKYEDLIRNLDELDFLTPRGLRNKNYTSYYITGTYYVFYVFKGDSGIGEKDFISTVNLNDNLTFEKIFDELPEDVREKMVYHLDLFR